MMGRLRNQVGSVLVVTLIAGGVIAIGSAAIINFALQRQQSVAQNVKLWHAQFANQKALTLGGYLVTNSFILCKEAKFSVGNKKEDCIWGGPFRRQDSVTKVEDFDLQNPRYEEGRLTFDTHFQADNVTEVKSSISFELVNWGENPELANIIDKIPNGKAAADDDMFMVVMRATSYYLGKRGEPVALVQNGGIRRPLGHVVIQVVDNDPVCSLACRSGISQNPNPECRGPQIQEDTSESTISIKVVNQGPGPIYDLVVEKLIEYNKEYFDNPNERIPLDAMGDRLVFMPGEEITLSDQIICKEPKNVTTSRTVVRRVGRRRGRRGATTRTSVNTHFENLAKVYYGISVSRFDPEKPSTRGSSMSRFLASEFNPHSKSSYNPNKTVSRLEPKKVATSIERLGDITAQRKVVTKTIITTIFVPSH